MDDTGRLPLRHLSLDLEVGRRDGRIRAFAAVRAETGEALTFRGGALGPALAKLDAFAVGADCLLGHNLIAFDLPHLAAANPDLRLFRLPAVDTLRLNPLAFPRNPYHHLVKHYQDGQLKRGRVNDPELDARLALEVFADQQKALKALRDEAPDLLAAWHWLATTAPGGAGFDAFFAAVRDAPRPSGAEARAAIDKRLAGAACSSRCRAVLAEPAHHGWALAYALAWLSVAGGNSVMPPWVRHQFPEAGVLVRRLRDTACNDPACAWCRERHDARKELARWFGFSDFRPEPKDGDGRPMQRAIVEAAMAGESVLGILPTGTGKSLCYQITALSRYDKTGALTVVISPLVALMADQVAGLEREGIGSCVTVNGLLSMPERKEALDRVRLGDAGILIVAPEQLRSRAVRRTLEQREIGAWVLDEAHCLSRWGHDFRPDYRYVARFIRERAGDAPVLCLTATAKPDVKEDVRTHFRVRLGIELRVFDGGASRTNLEFVVVRTTPGEKLAHVHGILTADLPPDTPGGAIVYCATRRGSEDVAQFLRDKDVAADHFHAGLSPEIKQTVQQRFIEGGSRVIVATNAFGMGIDKPDVRLVVHADVPGSLENYLQEAGRAGRDRAAARCVLLYTPEDVERQFGLSARSRLTRREILGILKALRRLHRKKRAGGEAAGASSSRAASGSGPGARDQRGAAGEVVATAGEILGEDEDAAFERDSATDDTRVRTAISWLEDARLLSREENRVQVFPSSLRVHSVAEARDRLARKAVPREDYRRRLLAIAETLIDADPDEGISTDELMGISGLSAEGVRRALYDLERLGIAGNDTVLTAFVHAGVPRASRKRFEQAAALECALIADLREAAPDMDEGGASTLHLRIATQRLKDALAEAGHDPRPRPAGAPVAHVARHRRGRPWRGERQGQPGTAPAGPRDGAGDPPAQLEGARGDRGAPPQRRTAPARPSARLPAARQPGHGSAGRDHARQAAGRAPLRPGAKGQGQGPREAPGPRPAVAARAGGRPPQQGAGGVPSRHVHPPERGPARLRQRQLRAAQAPLRRPGAAGPRDGGVRATGPRSHGGRAASGDGLLQLEPGGFPAPLAAGPGSGAVAADHPGVVATHRREPEESRPAAHRGRRPGADQRAGAGRPRLRQDPGAGASHRLPVAGEAREPPRRHRAGLQPARRGRDPPPPPGSGRRRRPRRHRAHLPRARHAPGRGQLQRPGREVGVGCGYVRLRRGVASGDGAAARRGTAAG